MASVRDALATAGLTGTTANRTRYEVYDAAGRIAYAIAADGAVDAYRYDGMGDVVVATRFATRRTTTALAGRAEMDDWVAANATAAADRTTRTLYDDARRPLRDRCGRVRHAQQP
ncbi:hypothetical protein AB5I41_22895 [Sphingomonas sp. MMS24-JH45]